MSLEDPRTARSNRAHVEGTGTGVGGTGRGAGRELGRTLIWGTTGIGSKIGQFNNGRKEKQNVTLNIISNYLIWSRNCWTATS